MFQTKDSGQRETFTTGAVRDIEDGKGFFDCLPYLAVKRLADLYQRGAKKYSKHNWKKGIDLDRCFSSMIRHAFQALAVHQGEAGQDMTAEDHLAAVVFNAFCVMHYQEMNKLAADKVVGAASTCHDTTLRRDGTQRLMGLCAPSYHTGPNCECFPKPSPNADLLEAEVNPATRKSIEKACENIRDMTRPTLTPGLNPRVDHDTRTQPVLYICGQLTNGGKTLPYDQEAVAKMNAVSAELMQRGFACLMPQLTVHFPEANCMALDGQPRSFESSHQLWLNMDKTLIRRCDGLVRVNNGPSKGADQEIAFAESLGIPHLKANATKIISFGRSRYTVNLNVGCSAHYSLESPEMFRKFYPVGKVR